MKNPPAGEAKAGSEILPALAGFLARPQAVDIKSAQLNYARFAMKEQGFRSVLGVNFVVQR